MSEETTKRFSDEMHGTLWKNEGEKKDRAPDYTGTAVISGVKVRIAMWGPMVAPTSKKKYLSLRFEYPQGTQKFLVGVRPADVTVESGKAVAKDPAEAGGETSSGDASAEDMPF